MKSITINNITYLSTELDKIPREKPWQQAIVDFLQAWFDEKDTIIVQTSGSTGTPKTYQLKKQCMLHSARMTNAFFGLNETHTALLCLPANYIAGKMMLVRAIAGGYNLLTVEPSGNPFETIQQEIDFTAITPYQLQAMLNDGDVVETLHARSLPIRNIIIGGAPISTSLENQCRNLTANLYETYGMTETCSHIALRKLNLEKAFTVLGGISILQDDRNCLVISAPQLSEEELHTNDIVELIDEKHFRWLGRVDFVINSGGVKIHPELLERKLEGLISQRYFIASLPDEKLGEKMVLVVESETSISGLEDKIKDVTERFEIPKEIFYVTQFVCSEGGKILRKETLSSIK